MTIQKRLDRVYQTAPEIPFDDTSRLVFMSDCHRGDGSWADNFARNQNLCYAALRHYYIKGFTYFELGDGDELWENKCLCDIVTMHSDIFSLMARFYREGRLYMLYGNHDMAKKSKSIYKSYAVVEDEFEQTKKALFPDIAIHESLKLRHRRTGREILLTHGDQADFLYYRLWRLARFLVRYLWRPLELSGINDPTDPGKNYHKKSRVHQCLSDWSAQNQCMLIAGHTHKPALPPPGTQYCTSLCHTGIPLSFLQVLYFQVQIYVLPAVAAAVPSYPSFFPNTYSTACLSFSSFFISSVP